MTTVILSMILVIAAILAPLALGRFLKQESMWLRPAKWGTRAIFGIIALFLFASTSYVSVGSDEVALLNKVYGTSSLEGEHIIATNGEKGPQADMLPPGFHVQPFVNVLYSVQNVKQVVVPSGKYGLLTAKDGAQLRPQQYLADLFPSDQFLQMLDAKYFLTHGGQRGPQATILPPGVYRLNTYLWDVDVTHDATDIAEGEVGVIKSNIVSAVNFGRLSADEPKSCDQKTVSTDISGKTVSTTVNANAGAVAPADSGKLTAILVPVGCIGVWETPLQPGRYYLNENAYKVTKISTRVQTLEFKGGYIKRYIDLSVDQAGKLTQTERSEQIDKPAQSSDGAVSVRIEGWLVPLELRVLLQVTPDNAPFVVASVGDLEAIEHNIMIPTIRSIVRNVAGAKDRHVLDLMDARAVVEGATEAAIRPEGLKAGIVIKEVRFGDPVLPPELLVSRLRKQLADQLSSTYAQEEAAQAARIEVEKKRATAEQQHDLVAAEIGVQVAEQNKQTAMLTGEGEKLRLEQVAQGQAAQANVLGQDRVMTITLVQAVLAAIKDKPEIVSLIGKMVPTTVVTTGGASGGGLDSAAAIFGSLLREKEPAAATIAPAVPK